MILSMKVVTSGKENGADLSTLLFISQKNCFFFPIKQISFNSLIFVEYFTESLNKKSTSLFKGIQKLKKESNKKHIKNREKKIMHLNQNTSNDSEDIDFSIIGPQESRKNNINFSIQQLLAQEDLYERKKKSQNEREEQQGSFLKDLAKIEKQISFDSAIYNIYETSESPNQYTATLEGKHESTCVPTFNQLYKGSSRLSEKFADLDYGHLIVNFKKEKDTQKKKAEKELLPSFDYFGLNRCCRCKEVSMHKNWGKQAKEENRQFIVPYPRCRVPQYSKSKKKITENHSNSYQSLTRPFNSIEEGQKKNRKFKKSKKPRKKNSPSQSCSSENSSSHSSIKNKQIITQYLPLSNNSLVIQEYFGYAPNSPAKSSITKCMEKSNSKIKTKAKRKSGKNHQNTKKKNQNR